jgi:proline iminopeptidase
MTRGPKGYVWALFSVAVFGAPHSSAAQPPADTLLHPPGSFVSINGANIWYESEGQGEPVILIAGGPGVSHTYFHPFFSGLAENLRVIYFDAFGSGKSDRARSAQEYTFDREVEIVEALRNHLKLERVTVFGHSYGGMVAQAYAVKYPHRLRNLILCDAPYNAEAWQISNDVINDAIQNQFPEVWEQLQQLRRRGFHGSSKEHQELYGRIPPTLFMFYHPANPAKPVFEVNTDVLYQIAGDDAEFLVGGDVVRLDFRTALSKLHIPVLVLAGRFDRAIPPRLALEYKHFLPDAKLVIFEESGHAPFVEETSRFVEAVKMFLRK